MQKYEYTTENTIQYIHGLYIYILSIITTLQTLDFIFYNTN
jgi:hypothetical protein